MPIHCVSYIRVWPLNRYNIDYIGAYYLYCFERLPQVVLELNPFNFLGRSNKYRGKCVRFITLNAHYHVRSITRRSQVNHLSSKQYLVP